MIISTNHVAKPALHFLVGLLVDIGTLISSMTFIDTTQQFDPNELSHIPWGQVLKYASTKALSID